MHPNRVRLDEVALVTFVPSRATPSPAPARTVSMTIAPRVAVNPETLTMNPYVLSLSLCFATSPDHCYHGGSPVGPHPYETLDKVLALVALETSTLVLAIPKTSASPANLSSPVSAA